MNAAAAAKKPAAKARIASVPFHEWLSVQINQSGKTNVELADALGYPRPNVIAMLKTGAMKLPLNKIGQMSRALGIDPVFLLQRVLSDSAPEMWSALNEVLSGRLVTGNEMALVEFVRSRLPGIDANVIGYKEFSDALEGPLEMIAKREKELANATLVAMRRK